jgi:hypothetical protein
VEPFLPVARRLQDLKMGLEEAIPWLETIVEKAESERIDEKTAAYRVAAELRFYRQFAGIQKAIEQAKQQLSVLDMFTEATGFVNIDEFASQGCNGSRNSTILQVDGTNNGGSRTGQC